MPPGTGQESTHSSPVEVLARRDIEATVASWPGGDFGFRPVFCSFCFQVLSETRKDVCPVDCVVNGNAPGRTRRVLILSLWAMLICCVVIGSLAPAASPLMVAIGRLHIWDKLQHFGAYLALSFLPVIDSVIGGVES